MAWQLRRETGGERRQPCFDGNGALQINNSRRHGEREISVVKAGGETPRRGAIAAKIKNLSCVLLGA